MNNVIPVTPPIFNLSVSFHHNFRWPLAISSWTLADKLSIAKWLVCGDRYTMGEKVTELESLFSEFSGAHALMVSNGSVANQLVFELWKAKNPGVKPVVIVPAVTWVSSVSPAIMAGCDVNFVDVNLRDFAFDYDMAERLVENHTAKGRRVILFPTALIGFAPDMARLRQIAHKWGADLFLDSCENTFSRVPSDDGAYTCKDGTLIGAESQSILASADMTTTSGYVSHHWSTVEGGFVFFRNRDDYDLGRLFRNHGLVRSLPADHPLRIRIQKDHPDVDPQFLFALAGTNMRPTDVHAMFGLADFKRIDESIAHRNRIYRAFHDGLDRAQYYLPPLNASHVGFCLPIINLYNDETLGDGATMRQIKRALTAVGIENRPLIGSCLPAFQPPFRDYGPAWRYPNAHWLHYHSCYTGLHGGVTLDMVKELTDLLNSINPGATLQKAA